MTYSGNKELELIAIPPAVRVSRSLVSSLASSGFSSRSMLDSLDPGLELGLEP